MWEHTLHPAPRLLSAGAELRGTEVAPLCGGCPPANPLVQGDSLVSVVRTTLVDAIWEVSPKAAFQWAKDSQWPTRQLSCSGSVPCL